MRRDAGGIVDGCRLNIGSLHGFKVAAVAVLSIALGWMTAFAADQTAFDYGDVERDVTDIGFYQGPADAESIRQSRAILENEVRNVILMIGDGMAPAHVQLARMNALGADGKLFMERLPVLGLMRTHSISPWATDSAAAGTALACGIKTHNGMLGLGPDRRPYKNLIEAARELGKRTGLVATAAISHATPAAFASHVRSRKDDQEIAAQILEQKINVIFGGGKEYWRPGNRNDGRDLLAEAESMGYAIVSGRQEMRSAKGGLVLGLFSEGHPETFRPEPMIAEMTDKALQLLSAEENGFFIMIEGSQIDWASHANNSDNAIRQTLLFDQAVRKAVKFAVEDRHTLLLVTSDHDCGGLTVFGKGGEHPIEAKWSTGGHSAMDVPVYAYGPGSDRFSGVLDNTELAIRVARLMGVEDFPLALEVLKE